jgi:hypothetical protein
VENDSARARRLLAEFVDRQSQVDTRDQLDATAATLLAAFDRTGVHSLLLKGPVLARVLYEPAEERTYGDVDILVEPAALERARGTLRRGGWVCLREVFGVEDIGGGLHGEVWFADGVMVDLHWQLPGAEAPAQIAWESLYAMHEPIEVAGECVAMPNRAALALHVATHAAQHASMHPRGLRDLELALERWPPDVWVDAADLAHEIGATTAFAAGLQLAPAGQELAGMLNLPDAAHLGWAPLHEWPRGTYHLRAFINAESFTARTRIVRRALLPPPRWILWEYPWARRWRLLQIAAYAMHFIQAPLWAARTLRFHRRRLARRDSRAPHTRS